MATMPTVGGRRQIPEGIEAKLPVTAAYEMTRRMAQRDEQAMKALEKTHADYHRRLIALADALHSAKRGVAQGASAGEAFQAMVTAFAEAGVQIVDRTGQPVASLEDVEILGWSVGTEPEAVVSEVYQPEIAIDGRRVRIARIFAASAASSSEAGEAAAGAGETPKAPTEAKPSESAAGAGMPDAVAKVEPSAKTPQDAASAEPDGSAKAHAEPDTFDEKTTDDTPDVFGVQEALDAAADMAKRLWGRSKRALSKGGAAVKNAASRAGGFLSSVSKKDKGSDSQ